MAHQINNQHKTNHNNDNNNNNQDDDDDCPMITTTTSNATTSLPSQKPPPTVYGELSILGYNGYIPNVERNGRRNRSKFLLCQRQAPNGIKKSRHYIVKQQPQATKAIQDKDLHSISYTFSRSQTIIVEYRQDENTDMFQIGRSSEDPIDFVVMDTMATNVGDPSSNYNQNHYGSSSADKTSSSSSSHHHNPNPNPNNHQVVQYNENNHGLGGDILSGISRLHRNLAKVSGGGADELIYGGHHNDNRNRLNYNHRHNQVLLNYPQPNMPNLAPIMADQFRQNDSALFQQQQHQQQPPIAHNNHHHYHQQHQQDYNLINPIYQSSSSRHQHHIQQQLSPQQAHLIQSSMRSNNISSGLNNQQQHHSSSSRHNNNNNDSNLSSNNNTKDAFSSNKRSHATQSTISRFACRILVDRHPPYTARIYAAGFDSSKNIFLGEKATKWEQDNSIDGLTTNGVLLMHPKKNGDFYEQIGHSNDEIKNNKNKFDQIMETNDEQITDSKFENSSDNNQQKNGSTKKQFCSKYNNKNNELEDKDLQEISSAVGGNVKINSSSSEQSRNEENTSKSSSYGNNSNDSFNNNNNNNNELKQIGCKLLSTKQKDINNFDGVHGGVWREVSVDGGIYAIRESRSAAQKGTRIESESNILQDGTLIDLCGATLLWRSVDGFRASPTKKSLEEKIDMLNASRPQCPVGLNTLVIPRKPIIPAYHQQHSHNHHNNNNNYGHHNYNHHHNRSSKGGESSKDNDKSSHQPYVYLKCGHVQGYHDWGATDKLNQRTCPICLSVGTVAKLSMGLEPSFYVDSGPLTHVFNPCGHMASEKTVKYWSSIKIPHGTHFFHSICPFCATPLATSELPSTKLIFQDDLD